MKKTTTRLALGLAALPILTGCVPPEGYAEKNPPAPRPQYTDEEVKEYKKEFARISEWPIPDNPDSLVDYGIKICDVIEMSGVAATKAAYKKQADGDRDWRLTDDVARAATATLCSEYKGQWEQALPPM